MIGAFVVGSVVNAECMLDAIEAGRLRGEPFGQDYFLLIPAAQVHYYLRKAGGFNPKPLDIFSRHITFEPWAEKIPTDDFA